ncbi:MAG: glycosyltransferase family 4 protein [Cytophagales bacterium]|nr:glycosyltransferase family 4 protein [Cytophagales bacterium]
MGLGMRILQVHNLYLNRGGEESVIASEGELLRERGEEVHLLEFDNKSLFESKLPFWKRFLYLFYNKEACTRFRLEVLSFRPDVIHFHNLAYYASPALIREAQKLGIPSVCTLHNFRWICIKGLLFRGTKICLRCVGYRFPFWGIFFGCFQGSRVRSLVLQMVIFFHQLFRTFTYPRSFIVFNSFIRDLFLKSLIGVPKERFRIKANFARDRVFSTPEERSSFFLFVGRLIDYKGIPELLRIFDRVSQPLHILGTGPLEEDIIRFAGSHGHIKYMGFQSEEEVSKQMRSCQALLFPSLCYEGFPRVIAEAFSFGTPVLAFENDNLSTLVKDGYNGYLFSREDISSFAEKIQSWEATDPNHEPLYTHARKTYEDLCIPEKNYHQLIRIYKEACTPSPIKDDS